MVEHNTSITNPALVQGLELLHTENTPAHQNRVLDEVVMRARFLSPVVLPDHPQEKNSDAIQFQLISTQDGRAFFPAFTDLGELRKFSGPRIQNTVVLTFDNYAAMLASNPKVAGFVVNPMDRPLTLERDFVAHLARRKQEQAGYSHQTIEKDAKVVLGEAKDCPQALLDAVRLAAGNTPDIHRLFLRLMSRSGQTQPSYLIVVDHSGEQSAVFQTIADAARPHLENRRVDMVPYQSELGQAAAKDAVPFFSRHIP